MLSLSIWDRPGFVAWLKSSPRHVEEFLEYSRLSAGLQHVQPTGIDDDLRQLRDQGNIADWPRSAQQHEQGPHIKNKRRWWFTSFAAAVLILASAVVLGLLQDHAKVLTTVMRSKPDNSTVFSPL